MMMMFNKITFIRKIFLIYLPITLQIDLENRLIESLHELNERGRNGG